MAKQVRSPRRNAGRHAAAVRGGPSAAGLSRASEPQLIRASEAIARKANAASLPRADAKALERIRDLVHAGRHADAIDTAAAALESTEDPSARLDLLDARVTSALALLELARAENDAQQMIALADRSRSAAAQARALCAMAAVQARQERVEPARKTAAAALRAARRSGEPALVALALLRQATAEMLSGSGKAEPTAAEAARRFEELGDAAQQSQALRVLCSVRLLRADTPANRALGERAVELARAAGDKGAERRGVNTLYASPPDLAQRLRGLKAALQLAIEAGDRQQEASALHNLCLTYNRLGLRHHALRLMRRSLDLRGASLAPQAALNPLLIVCTLQASVGDRAGFEEALVRLQSASEAAKLAPGSKLASWIQHAPARGERWIDPGAAVTLWRPLVRGLRDSEWGKPLVLAMTTRAELRAGNAQRALALSERAASLVRRRSGRLGGGAESDAHVLWQHSRALRACGRDADAVAVAGEAYQRLLSAIETMSDEGLRRSYLHAPTSHAELLASWVEAARERRLAPARYRAHLGGASELGESVERLVESGLRLNGQPTEAALHEALIEEVAELLGARRALLVLEDAGGRRVAGAQLPDGEDATALLAAIGPWLDEANTRRSSRLLHGPDGADPIDQRSCIVAPLISHRDVLGFVYADLEG
ncbi:MAG TPA: hypothetical protein PLR35_17000, partial [Burkholderiaceae bacterium]|nr:hypothetical protein [Burkholderiaceae bacterium]